jgi:orotate phosphoribosyltransferase
MNQTEVHALLEQHGAIQHGHFLLSGGLHSDTFVQTALVTQHPGITERLGHSLGERFEPSKPTIVLAPAVAGLIIGHEVARYLNVPMVFCERVDGAMTLRRGFEISSDDRVLIVDNAMTDGGSKREVVEMAKSLGAEVVGVAIIVDRSSDVSLGVPLESLIALDTQEWKPEDCPLCAEGSAPVSPGSRHLAR